MVSDLWETKINVHDIQKRNLTMLFGRSISFQLGGRDEGYGWIDGWLLQCYKFYCCKMSLWKDHAVCAGLNEEDAYKMDGI